MDIKKIDWKCTKCGKGYYGYDCHICPYCKHDDRLAYMENMLAGNYRHMWSETDK